jgi:hypothetical protein
MKRAIARDVVKTRFEVKPALRESAPPDPGFHHKISQFSPCAVCLNGFNTAKSNDFEQIDNNQKTHYG